MDWKIEVVTVPVSDIDRAKAFYVEKVGFEVDIDHRISDETRLVQLTPPGSACSIHFAIPGMGMETGSLDGVFLVVPDVRAARAESSPNAAWRSVSYRSSTTARTARPAMASPSTTSGSSS
jgi:catechol 2,3-dioxygenase-like lactoylglutathione lyase family enzyme